MANWKFLAICSDFRLIRAAFWGLENFGCRLSKKREPTLEVFSLERQLQVNGHGIASIGPRRQQHRGPESLE